MEYVKNIGILRERDRKHSIRFDLLVEFLQKFLKLSIPRGFQRICRDPILCSIGFIISFALGFKSFQFPLFFFCSKKGPNPIITMFENNEWS
jgi:hypothetical protein